MAMVENGQELGFDHEYSLKAAFTCDTGRAFLTGIDALVRLPLMQRRIDERDGRNTAGFISGYRGSPLGGYDQALWRHKKLLAERDIHFEPGINEDLGATNIWGTQLLDHYRRQAPAKASSPSGTARATGLIAARTCFARPISRAPPGSAAYWRYAAMTTPPSPPCSPTTPTRSSSR